MLTEQLTVFNDFNNVTEIISSAEIDDIYFEIKLLANSISFYAVKQGIDFPYLFEFAIDKNSLDLTSLKQAAFDVKNRLFDILEQNQISLRLSAKHLTYIGIEIADVINCLKNNIEYIQE